MREPGCGAKPPAHLACWRPGGLSFVAGRFFASPFLTGGSRHHPHRIIVRNVPADLQLNSPSAGLLSLFNPPPGHPWRAGLHDVPHGAAGGPAGAGAGAAGGGGAHARAVGAQRPHAHAVGRLLPGRGRHSGGSSGRCSGRGSGRSPPKGSRECGLGCWGAPGDGHGACEAAAPRQVVAEWGGGPAGQWSGGQRGARGACGVRGRAGVGRAGGRGRRRRGSCGAR